MRGSLILFGEDNMIWMLCCMVSFVILIGGSLIWISDGTSRSWILLFYHAILFLIITLFFCNLAGGISTFLQILSTCFSAVEPAFVRGYNFLSDEKLGRFLLALTTIGGIITTIIGFVYRILRGR